jgi:gamma-glutamyltranspeptidase/glutathione hydrolase
MGSAGKEMKATAVYPGSTPQFMQFPSRRSVVHSTKGIVACTQPLAAEAGQRILKQGGNAAVSPCLRQRLQQVK